MRWRVTKPEQCLTAVTPVSLGRRLAKATAAIFTSEIWTSGNTRQQPLPRMIVSVRINLGSIMMIVVARVAMK